MFKKALIFTILFLLPFGICGKADAHSNVSNWAKPEIDKAENYGLIPDSLKGKDMTKAITREEFAEVIIRLYEKATGFTASVNISNPFTDTKNSEILKAYQIGITAGTSATTFEPNKLINREQVASMLSRAIRIMVPTADFSTDGAPTFKDEKYISNWALEHVRYMSKIGIIKGTDGNFMPRATTPTQVASGYANTSREQAIAMSVRTLEKYDITRSSSNDPNIISDDSLTARIDANAKGFMFILEFALGAPLTTSQERVILDELKSGWNLSTEEELSEYDAYPTIVDIILTLEQPDLDELRIELEALVIEWIAESPDSDKAVKIIKVQLETQGKVVVAGNPPLTEMSLTAYSEIMAYSRLLKQNSKGMPEQISQDSVKEIKKLVKDNWRSFTAKEQEQIATSPSLWFCLRTLVNNGSDEEQDNVRNNLVKLDSESYTVENNEYYEEPQDTNNNQSSGSSGKPMSMVTHTVLMNMNQMTFNSYMWSRGFNYNPSYW